MRIGSVVALLLAADGVLAHGPFDEVGQPLWPGLIAMSLLGMAWLLYVVGSLRLAPRIRHGALFHATALLAALTLVGPMDAWAETSLAAHMIQHALVMVVIAPLWVLARPLPQWRAALTRQGYGHDARRHSADRRGGVSADVVWRLTAPITRHPLLAALVHAAAIWVWHTPRPYMLAVDDALWHVVEHACFLLSGCVFWWAVLRAPPRRQGHALIALLFTLMHTGLLGALLTFARTPLYSAAYPLADQQLAGLIMWVPMGLIYLLAAGWLSLRWQRRLAARLARPPDKITDGS
jgi:putative membrane protein